MIQGEIAGLCLPHPAAWWCWCLPDSPHCRAFRPLGSAPTITPARDLLWKAMPSQLGSFAMLECATCINSTPEPSSLDKLLPEGLRQRQGTARASTWQGARVSTCFAMPVYTSTARRDMHRDQTEALLNVICYFCIFFCFLNIGKNNF